MKHIFIITLFLLFNFISYSQNNFGIKLSGGISRISIKSYPPYSPYGVPWDSQFTLSGNIGLFYTANIDGKSSLGVELLFQKIEGKQTIKVEETDFSGSLIKADDNIYKHISYISFPFYYGVNFSKVTLTLGGQISPVISSSANEKVEIVYKDTTVNLSDHADKLALSDFDFGLRGGIMLKLSDKFAVEAVYYYGLKTY